MRKMLLASAVLTSGFAILLSGQPASRDVRVTLHEGTSMAAAVSPDGGTVVLDLLGALWSVPIAGGTATRLIDDGYDARMPAWSPDGRRIAFQAYRSGTWGIWVVDADGRNPRGMTSGPFDDREPHWSPDGTRVAFSSDRSGNYDVWTLTLATGDVTQITTNPANDFMPAWSPDGSELAFVSDRRERPGVYAIAVTPPEGPPGRPKVAPTGPDVLPAERLVTAASGALAGPSWSPDGKTVAFNVIEAGQSRLIVGETNIADPSEDVFPFRPHWTSGGDLVYTADGKIKRRPASGGTARTIEFSASIAFSRPAFVPKPRPLTAQGVQTARGIMHPAISPDGRSIAFAALGDLWLMPVIGSEPRRLTTDPFLETDPAWSPDGKTLAFSSDRAGTMDLWLRDVQSGGERKLAGGAMSAAWSPDGSRIAFLDPESQLQIADVASGKVSKAHDRLNEPGRPSWSPDGRAIVMSALKTYSARFREGTNQVLRVSPDGQPDRWIDPIPHKSIGMREDYGPVWSPDGMQMAAVVDGHLVAFAVARDGTAAGPPRRLSTDLANSPTWTGDSRRVLYQSDDRLKLVDVIDGTVQEIAPRITWTPKVSAGKMVVHAGRLFDARSGSLRENMDIVIDGNRIANVETHRQALHAGQVVDASNETVLPGLIESHSHLTKGYGESVGRIFLSFGVTTVRNPATNPFEGQEDREAIASGARIGPRIVTTGSPLDGTRIYYPGGTALDGGAQIGEELQRAERLGFDFIKTYVRLPDLLQKRAIESAHRMGMPVTSHELYPAVVYGADGVEHIRGTSRRGYSPKVTQLSRSYADVVELLGASKMTLTPTIGIQGGNQLLTLRDPSWLDDTRIQRMFPASAWRPIRAFAQQSITPEQRAARESAVAAQERTVAEVVKAGGRVVAGTDSPIIPYGMALLMELEHYVNGGVTPADALRAATIVPAEAMGFGGEIGSIERGTLADLVIVEGNPIANIRDVRRAKRVVKDGILHDLDALLRGPVRRVPVTAARD